MKKSININEVKQFIEAQGPNTRVYIGGDSERYAVGSAWYADYTLAIVVHIDGNSGCKIFGEVQTERDWDQKRDRPRMRLMNEVMKIAELYMHLHEVLEDRDVEIHLDINPSERLSQRHRELLKSLAAEKARLAKDLDAARGELATRQEIGRAHV